jgi:hypothetical protein
VNALDEFFFGDRRMFMVPTEELSSRGMSAAFAARLMKARGLAPEWVARFDQAVALFFQRVAALYQRAPRYWFPPRLQNICVVSDNQATRPYYQPFHLASWVVDEADFDDERGSVELAVFGLVFAERLGLARNLVPALLDSLSYFLILDEAALGSFHEGARRSTRADAAAIRALSEALSWVRRLHHPDLAPAAEEAAEPSGKLESSGLVAPLSLQQPLRDLAAVFRRVSQEVAGAFLEHVGRQGGEPASALCRWLAEERPDVVIMADSGRLWSPEDATDTSLVSAALETVVPAAAASIRADLEVASERSRRFLASLKHPERLQHDGGELEQRGLTYLHQTERRIAYNLHEPGPQRLMGTSAPYERTMLGARTIHEWCHLAVDAGVVPLSPERQGDHDQAEAELGALLDEVLAHAPREPMTEQEIERYGGKALAGRSLASLPGRRMPDYQCNLLALRYWSAAERETYIRQQVRTHAQDDVGPYTQLMRCAIEYQYLALSDNPAPWHYFVSSTWFRELYVAPGLVTERAMRHIVDLVQKLTACYRVDESAFV